MFLNSLSPLKTRWWKAFLICHTKTLHNLRAGGWLTRLIYTRNKVQILTVTVIRQFSGVFEDSRFHNILRSVLQVEFSSGFREIDADVSSIGAYMSSIPIRVSRELTCSQGF